MNKQVIVITSTYPSRDEALRNGKQVVALRLAACAQVSSAITSIYRWKSEICKETEFKLTLKTTEQNKTKLMNHLKNNHSYELPEIIAIPSTDTSKEFYQWVKRETS